MARVVLDLHGSRARLGVDIDALESFLMNFRAALREYNRAGRGGIPRTGGRPTARDAAATAFRLVEFHPGSGIATLEPSLMGDVSVGNEVALDAGEPLAVTTLHSLLDAIIGERRLPGAVVEALDSARRAIGDDGSFGVEVSSHRQMPRVVIDQNRMQRLHRPQDDTEDTAITVTGRLHMIEVDQPGRRVGIRGQDGIDWVCSYPDHLHPVVTTLIERLVRVEGVGRRLTSATGRMTISRLEPIPEHAQGALFTVEPVPLDRLMSGQDIDRPQGLDALVDAGWEDDEASRLFLEATLGDSRFE